MCMSIEELNRIDLSPLFVYRDEALALELLRRSRSGSLVYTVAYAERGEDGQMHGWFELTQEECINRLIGGGDSDGE